MKSTETFGTVLIGGIALLLLHGLTRKDGCNGCGDSDNLGSIQRTALRPLAWRECRDGFVYHCVARSWGNECTTRVGADGSHDRCKRNGFIAWE